ncbi:hypothetical protein T05_6933 [Trichinella murrelli]|uniref:Uncharacterized protein n=1 Tax=Trichinella murrelli TaxID=144512 RepID=A0A0V0TDS4_9BILA|nr:hypothetical protein T05_6933 [Trichinella murrelli]
MERYHRVEIRVENFKMHADCVFNRLIVEIDGVYYRSTEYIFFRNFRFSLPEGNSASRLLT